MRCPICGSKMVQNQLCKYCNITDDQVINASNKKVSEYRKKDMKDLIHFTNVVPKDVSRLTLLLFTIFLGIVGVNHYYVKRHIRGLFSSISTGLSITLFIVSLLNTWLNAIIVFKIIFELAFYSMAINVILWVCDIINVAIKTFKIPVVLAEKGASK